MKKRWLLLILFLIPTFVYAEDSELASHAKSAILIEASSGKILYEKEINQELSIASMTKMVAQIIIMEEIEKGNIHWDDVVTVSRNASGMGGSQIYLEEGEKMSVEDLMKGISVASGNDATVAMAEYISGSEEKFVERMNAKVKELGLRHTHFVNSTGLDEEGHYSSSYDMAMIARDLVVHHSDILKFSSIYEDYLREDTDRKFWLVNTNKLISQYEGTDGLKTGHTDLAGYCLAATAERSDLRLIAIVLGEEESKVRNAETIQLLDYGFANTKLKVLKKKNSVVDSISFDKADKTNVSVVLKNSLSAVEDFDDNNQYDYQIHYNSYSLPLKSGDVIGRMDALLHKQVVSSSELIVLEDVQKLSLLQLFKQKFESLIFGHF